LSLGSWVLKARGPAARVSAAKCWVLGFQVLGYGRTGAAGKGETTMGRVIPAVMMGVLAMAWAAPVAAQDAKVAAGEKLFAAQKCSICHSVAGKGNVKKPLDGAGTRLDAAMIRLWLTDPKAAEAKAGKKAMPPMKSFATLPAADIDALVAYVQSLK